MSENIHALMAKEFESRRKSAQDSLLHRKDEVYRKVPAILEIDQDINLLGVQYSRQILKGQNNTDTIVLSLLEKIASLGAEREKLLHDHGIRPSDLEISFRCSECRDTGIVEPRGVMEKCSCYRQEMIHLLFKNSNLRQNGADNFSIFNIDYYPDTVDESRFGIPKSPREQILWIRDRSLKFIDNFSLPDEKNLFFCGPAGVGKTFMTNCIAVEILKSGKTVLYQTAPTLFDRIAEYKARAFKDEPFEDDLYKNIFDVELLIIDDLGTETRTPARYTELLNILNIRQTNNLTRPCKTIISTNMNMEKMTEYYTERVTSRIIGNFALYRFAGNDIRSLKR